MAIAGAANTRTHPSPMVAFFHPDYTVGSSISLDLLTRSYAAPLAGSAIGITAGRELHPALKASTYKLHQYLPHCKTSFGRLGGRRQRHAQWFQYPGTIGTIAARREWTGSLGRVH